MRVAGRRRPHLAHDRRTTSAGYSESCSEPFMTLERTILGASELLRFRSCSRLQFIAQPVGAFDGVYDHAIGTRDLVAQSLRTLAVSSFFYPRPSRLSDRGPGFLPALASGCFSPFPSHRDSPHKSDLTKHNGKLCQQIARQLTFCSAETMRGGVNYQTSSRPSLPPCTPGARRGP